MRYTDKDARAAFVHLCRILGKEREQVKDTTPESVQGKWYLHHDEQGYCVYEYCGGGYGVREPLGSRRWTAREFCECVQFVHACKFNYSDSGWNPRGDD